MQNPMLHYDRKQDILYIVLREGAEHHFEEIAEGVIVEFNEENHPIGVEIFNAREVIKAALGEEPVAIPV
jgi:uncharacterized protein YuzE